jgi:hypothetical protein
MHLRAKRPIFVPSEYWDEIEAMSKACLMDLVWDFATTQTLDDDDSPEAVMEALRARIEVITTYRKSA